MKRLLRALVGLSLIAMVAGCGPSQPLKPPPHQWYSGLEGFEELETAGKSSKPLLLAFLQTGCKPCDRLTRQVLFDKDFMRETEGIERLAVDLGNGEGEKFLARKFRVMSTPTLFLIVPEKKIVRKIELRRRENSRVIYPEPLEAAQYLQRLLQTLDG